MTDTTLYNSYLQYFSSANAAGCQPMTIEGFQHFWKSLLDSEREVWAKKFRIGFERVVSTEATFYRNAFKNSARPAKAA